MSEQNTPATGIDEVSTVDEFAAFEEAVKKGEIPDLPAEAKSSEAAADEQKADDTEAKTDPNSEAENKQDSKDGEEEGEEEKPAAKKGGFQRRIDKLTREKQELAQRLDSIERRLADNPAAQPKETKPAADGLKSIDEFDTVQDYVKYLVKEEREQSQKATAEAKAQEEQRATMDAWSTKTDAARDKYDDFDEVLANRELKLSPTMQTVIFDSEQGADLAYWLGKNPEEAKRIYSLKPVAAARELLKVEATFVTPKPTTPANGKHKASAAPEPIKPISSTKGGTSHDPYGLETGDFGKFEKARIRDERGA